MRPRAGGAWTDDRRLAGPAQVLAHDDRRLAGPAQVLAHDERRERGERGDPHRPTVEPNTSSRVASSAVSSAPCRTGSLTASDTTTRGDTGAIAATSCCTLCASAT